MNPLLMMGALQSSMQMCYDNYFSKLIIGSKKLIVFFKELDKTRSL